MTEKIKTAPAEDIDEYLASVPAVDRQALEELRAIIRTAAPDAKEGISYRIPVFNRNGPLVFFAAFKNHLGFYAVSRQVLEEFKTDLKPYKVSGTTIHFSAAQPLPAALVTGIVKARIRENENRTSQNDQNIPQYVAFLRGINVGGHKPIKMQDLKSAFQRGGFDQVQTVLTSGNVVFESGLTDMPALTNEIADLLRKAFSAEIPILLRSMDDLVKIHAMDPFRGIAITPGIRLYLTFLPQKTEPQGGTIHDPPSQKGIQILQVTEQEVFSTLDLSQGTGTSELMKLLENRWGSGITTRNWNTILKVIKKRSVYGGHNHV